MRTNLIAAAVALAVALLPSAALAEKTRLTAVSGPVSGGWYLGVGLVAKAFTDANPNYEVTMLPGNSTSNVIQLQQKKANLSIGMHTMNMAAIKGTAPYKKAFPNIAAYANLNDTARFHFVVTKKSGITSIAQLRDSKMPVRLAYGAVGGSGEVFCGWIFESYGFTYKDIQSWGGKLYSNNFDDIVNMTKDGQLDAIVWVGPGESWFFTEIAQNVDLVWLPVDEKEHGRRRQEARPRQGHHPRLPVQGHGGQGHPDRNRMQRTHRARRPRRGDRIQADQGVHRKS